MSSLLLRITPSRLMSAASNRVIPSSRRPLTSLSPSLYTATSTSKGSRANGASSTQEGNVSLMMGMPLEMGGTKGPAGGVANPEQLFGMAYSTCFLSALSATHARLNPTLKPLAKATSVRARVSIGKDAKGTPGFLLAVELEIPSGPLAEAGLDPAAIKTLLDEAHKLCPYSRAVSGNVEVEIKLVDV